MTLTIFVLLRDAARADSASATRWKEEGSAKDDELEDQFVEEVRIRDPDSEVEEDGIPVAEASDDDDEDQWPERDDGPEHFGWEEVYDMNDCSPDYL